MPKYIKPNQYGVAFGSTGFIPRDRAGGLTQEPEGQQYPCTATGEPLTAEQVAEMMPTAEEIAIAEAQALIDSVPTLPATVSALLSGIDSAQAAGVEINISEGLPTWPEISAAFSSAISFAGTLDEVKTLVSIRDALDGNWREVEYQTNDKKRAYRLFPYFVQIIQG